MTFSKCSSSLISDECIYCFQNNNNSHFYFSISDKTIPKKIILYRPDDMETLQFEKASIAELNNLSDWAKSTILNRTGLKI